jgi:dienelactone hydrolase
MARAGMTPPGLQRRWCVILVFIICVFPGLEFANETPVTFQSRNGDILQAIYAPPRSGAPAPAVLIMHGCGGLFTKSGKIKSRERAWLALFQAEGAVLVPDSFGSRGACGSQCKVKKRVANEDDLRPLDAAGALKFLSTRPEIDPTRIVIAGWSNGAMTTLYTVREGSPAAPEPGMQDFRAALMFYPGCSTINKAYSDYRSRIPALIQHGAADDWTLAAPCVDLVKAANRRGSALMEIDSYEGAYHGFDHPTSRVHQVETRSSSTASGLRTVHVGGDPHVREKAIARTIGWLRQQLSQ